MSREIRPLAASSHQPPAIAATDPTLSHHIRGRAQAKEDRAMAGLAGKESERSDMAAAGALR